jgi:hypothetical protein
VQKVSLVVCVYKERSLLERLLKACEGCYDDLVVVHDGPEDGDPNWSPVHPGQDLAIDWSAIASDFPLPAVFSRLQSPERPGSLREYVRQQGGRFFEHPRIGSLEGQSPFAWWAAGHDWILRLDADEIPSTEMQIWLRKFRTMDLSAKRFVGFSCIWPLWDGRRATTSRWPTGRLFLFNKQSVRFFGLTEQTPIADGVVMETGLVLRHEPARKSYGIRNILFRKQAYVWRALIAISLLRTPLDLPRWRWSDDNWPQPWLSLKKRPLRYALWSLVFMPAYTTKAMLNNGVLPRPGFVFQSGLHHFLAALKYWQIHRSMERDAP